MTRSVALVLVAHDGARWLPTVIDGIKAQRAPISQVVAVDTGSKDDSFALLERAFPNDVLRNTVVRVPGSTTYPSAVRQALDLLRDAEAAGTEPPEWIWLLHDDSTPDPGALQALLDAADEHPDADILGPKLRAWPSLRGLLEIGVTISGTGRRETGLERGEYDHGQHDDVRTVLAVNTAGMLVRRSLLVRLGGFDPQLPIFGNDIDFGWRAASAGSRTIVVPQAVVFHAEAAHRGARRTPLTGRHTHYQERRAALYTLLVNSKARRLWFQVPRLAVGTVLRIIGFLLVRAVGTALDELAALLSVYSSPRAIHAARRERQGRQTVAWDDVRPLLSPWWLPYRHGLDFVSDVAAAATNQAADVAERRRAAKAEADPSSFAARRQEIVAVEDDEIPVENGWVVRFFTNPVAVLLTVVAILGIVGARVAFSPVSGGGLSPAPDGVGTWWRLVTESWHPLGQGTAVPAPPYLLPLAILGSIFLGHASFTVGFVLIASFPFALWGGWRLLRVVGRLVSHRGAPRWLVLWAATAYALVPAASGAWGDGRLGPVVAGAVLPWVAHAALGFADPEADRRWRAAWRTGMLLALIVAFTPVAWVITVVLGVVIMVMTTALFPSAMKPRSVWGPPVVALAVPVVLLAAWWLPALLHGAGAGLLLDAGRLPAPVVDGPHLLVGRLGDLGAPWWLGLVLPAAALAALIPRRTRIPVLVCWIGGVVAVMVALALGFVTFHLPATETVAGFGFPMVCWQGACAVAAVLGGQGLLIERGIGGGWRDWRRWVATVVGVLGLVGPVGGLVWFVIDGNESLTTDSPHVVPSYMLESSSASNADGVLVVRGNTQSGLRYTVVRGDGVTLGDDEIETLTPESRSFSRLVQDFVSRPTSDVVDELAAAGVRYVVLPPPADGSVTAAIDASGGLAQASAARRTTHAWQVDAVTSDAALDDHRSWLHVALVIVELGGVVVVLVLAAPTLRGQRASEATDRTRRRQR